MLGLKLSSLALFETKATTASIPQGLQVPHQVPCGYLLAQSRYNKD